MKTADRSDLRFLILFNSGEAELVLERERQERREREGRRERGEEREGER